MELRPLTRDALSLIKPYYEQYRLEASEVNLTNLFMWRHKYQFHYLIVEGFLWICNKKNASTFYFSQPIGDYSDPQAVVQSVITLKAWLLEQGSPLVIKKSDRVFLHLIQASELTAEVIEERDAFDYIYTFEDLKALPGNLYHKKKNHISKFMRSVAECDYLPLNDTTIEDLRNNFSEWFDLYAREGLEEGLAQERQAIEEMLSVYGQLPFSGAMILIDGKVEAYTLGEQLNDDTLLIHIEKANPNLPGLYPYINQQFLMHQTHPYQWVNREQDLGLEGLRKAKLSYHPAYFVEKYTLRF